MNVGAFGEEVACEYLQTKGYTVIARNVHSRYGEIDIIAQNERYLLFVEVKTRGLNTLSAPQEAVTLAKQHKLTKTAQWWLLSHPLDRQPRFDVLAITVDANQMRVLKTEHFENAFTVSAW